VIESIVVEVEDLARGSSHVKSVLDTTTERYGSLRTLLSVMDWQGADMAYFTWVRPKDGVAESVLKNVSPGQLVTALERGFLPVSLAQYTKEHPSSVPELVAAGDVRSDTGERVARPESSRLTDEDLTCWPCDRTFATPGGLARHMKSPSHINHVKELESKSEAARPTVDVGGR
jgi:hypothetical protein